MVGYYLRGKRYETKDKTNRCAMLGYRRLRADGAIRVLYDVRRAIHG